MKQARRPDFELPAPMEPEEFEGRERWEVHAYLDDGEVFGIECGRLREGVSREAALLAFEAVKSCLRSRDNGCHGGTETARKNGRRGIGQASRTREASGPSGSFRMTETQIGFLRS